MAGVETAPAHNIISIPWLALMVFTLSRLYSPRPV